MTTPSDKDRDALRELVESFHAYDSVRHTSVGDPVIEARDRFFDALAEAEHIVKAPLPETGRLSDLIGEARHHADMMEAQEVPPAVRYVLKDATRLLRGLADALAAAPLSAIGALPSSCEGYGVCLRHACLSAGRCTISAQSATPLTETFVQPVPDKCDRIVWRNRYWHLSESNGAQELKTVNGVPEPFVRSTIQPSGAWLPRSTNPDHDGLLWPITIRTDDGVLMMEFEYYHFDNGWATDEDIVAWWNQPVAPFSAIGRSD